MAILAGLLWLVGVGLLVALGIAFAATIPLMRRRTPDPADHPAQYGLPCAEVQFPSRDGTRLGGWWLAAPAPACGTLILCPGQNGSMDKDLPQAVPLVRAGFNVLLFDFRAHGRSEGRLVTLGARELGDLRGALDFLAGRGIERVGVLGFSMGAGVALLAAAQDTRIAAVVADGAYPRAAGLLARWARRRGIPAPLATGFAWLALLAGSLRCRCWMPGASPLNRAGQVRVPVLLIHGERDPFVPPADFDRLRARLPGVVEVWRVAEAGHREAFTLHPDDYNRRVIAWFEQHLAES